MSQSGRKNTTYSALASIVCIVESNALAIAVALVAVALESDRGELTRQKLAELPRVAVAPRQYALPKLAPNLSPAVLLPLLLPFIAVATIGEQTAPRGAWHTIAPARRFCCVVFVCFRLAY
jgi:hypothetical protein